MDHFPSGVRQIVKHLVDRKLFDERYTIVKQELVDVTRNIHETQGYADLANVLLPDPSIRYTINRCEKCHTNWICILGICILGQDVFGAKCNYCTFN